MPLSAATLENDIKGPLATELKTEIEAVFNLVPGIGAAELTKFCTAVANATAKICAQKVVAHITANALVEGDVTSGAGAGGKVVGVVK